MYYNIQREELEYQQRQQKLAEESNKPKCPTCHSTNIRKYLQLKELYQLDYSAYLVRRLTKLLNVMIVATLGNSDISTI